jgi:hypothetical protein
LLDVKKNMPSPHYRSSVLNAPRADHSRQPGDIGELIKQGYPGPHIEPFGRGQVNGAVRSRDGGDSWTDISGDLIALARAHDHL